jgi:hypothetical protein
MTSGTGPGPPGSGVTRSGDAWPWLGIREGGSMVEYLTAPTGDTIMTKGLRWRILVLQAGLVLILGFVAGFAFWAASFTHSSVTDQLAAQQITFPTAGNAEIKALPAADATAMLQYAGQTMTTGDQAQVYANDFIRIHLSAMPTYEQASAAARANPTNAKDAATLNTVFTGTSLRGMLLNAYGWWTVGTYALYAAIGLTVAAGLVLLSLGFEVWRWRVAIRAAKPVLADGPVPAFSTQPSGVGLSQFTRHDGN